MSHPTGLFLAQKDEGCREHLPAEESPLSFVRHFCHLSGQTQFCRGRDHSEPLSRPALAGLHLAGVAGATGKATVSPASEDPPWLLSLWLQPSCVT